MTGTKDCVLLKEKAGSSLNEPTSLKIIA